jgi:tetratricopeptide (TPR) repeat protein
VGAVAFLAYVGSVPSGFPYDDRSVVAGSPVVLGWVPPQTAFVRDWWGHLPVDGTIGSYRPWPVLALTLDYKLSAHFAAEGDRRAWPMHAVNVVLHALTMMLLYRVLLGLAAEPVALAAALLCSVIAAPSEVVQSLVGRADLLEALGLLGGWWAHRRRGAKFGVLAALGLALALGSKETGVMALVAWPVLDAILPDPQQPWRERRGRYVLYLAVLAIYLGARSVAIGTLALPRTANDFYNPLRATDLSGRVFGAGHVFLERYVLGLIDPRRRLYDCSAQACLPSGPGDVVAWAGLLLFIALLVLPVLLWKRAPVVAAGLAWSILFFAPVSNFFVPATLSYGERLLYVPMFGLALAAAQAASALGAAGWTVLFAVGALNAASLQRRHEDWRSDATLAASGLRWGADSVIVQENNATAALDRGDAVAAEAFGRRAIALVPEDAYGHKVLAVALLQQGRLAESEAEFKAALAAEPRSDLVQDYASFLARQQRFDEALELVRKQERRRPQDAWLKTLEGKLERARERGR